MTLLIIAALKWFWRFTFPLFVAESMFIPFLEKRDHFWLRFIGSSLLFFFVATLGNYYSIYPSYEWFKSSFAIVFLLSLAPLLFSLKASFKTILFYAMSAYAIQNCLDNVENLIYITAGIAADDNIRYLVQVVSLIAVYAIFFMLFVRNIKNHDFKATNNIVFYLVLAITLGVTYGLSMFAFLHDAPSSISARIYSIVACVLLLSIQFGLFEKSSLERQKETLEQIIEQENKSNQAAKENMDLVNIKCHDLKHQIKTLREVAHTDEEKQSLDELSDQVSFFDTNINSGNEALDTILSEKSLICQKQKIKFSYIVDGKRLDFMDSLDVYSLFGNALDNAIEALSDVSEDKRIITINIRERNSLLGIHIENYCPKTLTFKDGLPTTTNADVEKHGFGTKSIRYVTNKYHGTLAFRVTNNIFNLNICFPLNVIK
jgi:hypothetical protein